MAHHKRKRPKKRRSGCGLCKPHKQNGAKNKEKPAVRRKMRPVQEEISEESDQEIAFEIAATFKVRDEHGDLIERLSEVYYLFKKTGS